MSAKATILKRLRKGATPFTEIEPIIERRVIVPMDGVELLARFVQEAEALSAKVYQAKDEQSAIETILTILADDKDVLTWDFEHIPLAGLENILNEKNVALADSRNGSVRVGITGAEVALAATGSLVMSAKEGRARSVSLLPYVHIAIIKQEQILPHFDAWIEQVSQDKTTFREVRNHVVITGASRTADIGMELVLGAHGPAELHIIVLS